MDKILTAISLIIGMPIALVLSAIMVALVAATWAAPLILLLWVQ